MPQATEHSWLELLRAFWPIMLVLAALIWGTIELRVRKILADERKSLTEAHNKALADLRTELQTKMGNIGNDAMEALTLARKHESQIVELRTKMDIFWGMLERSTAGFLKQQSED